jgi:formylmethanofuran dehydrogenase subunit E
MAVLGCAAVGIEDPRGVDRDKLVVWVEIDRWLADAVESVTGARLGKRTLKFLDYGKLADTFLNLDTGKAVRIVALESSRRLADLRHPEIEDKYERQMRTYREAAEEELFGVTDVEVQVRAKDLPGHPRSRVICHKCGEGVNDGREISLPDRITLCRPCVYGTYYQPQHKSVDRTWVDQAETGAARI